MSPVWPNDPITRWSRNALRMAGLLVPAGGRRAWLDEWEAELWQLRSVDGSLVGLTLFLSGACWHGIWEWREGWRMDLRLQDIKLAFRTLARSPGFGVVAVLMLALPIGANTALFSVLEEAVLAEPPFVDPDGLVVVDMLFGLPGTDMQPSEWSYPRYKALSDEVQSVQDLAGYNLRTMTLTELGDPSVISVETVTPSLFPLLGIGAILGRVFGPGEEDDGAADMVALVSNSFWQTRMGAVPDVLGGTLTLDRLRFEVVGVLPPAFDGITGGANVWIPLSALREVENATQLEDPWNQHFHVMGRLASTATLASARSEVQAFGATLMERFPGPVGTSRIRSGGDVVPFMEARMNPEALGSMFALFGAVILVLLIAVANLAGLLLARGATRKREAAIRASLGAGRARLMGQLLTESLTLALVGGILGIGMAWLGVDALGVWLGDALGTGGGRGLEYLDTDALSINWRVLGFAIALTAGVGIGCGILPAWQAARTDPSDALKGGASAGGLQSRIRGSVGRNGLIVVQVGVAMVLLAGASLMMRSMLNLQRVDPGYDQENLLTAMYSLSTVDEQAGIDPGLFHMDFLERVRAMPGVVGATLGEVPIGGPTWRTVVLASDGRPDLTPALHTWIRIQPVADGHLEVMGAEMIEGRGIQSTDDWNTDKVIVLSRGAAELLFPEGGPIGQRIQLGWSGYGGAGALVVGVVEALQLDDPTRPAQPQGFVAVRQAPRLETGVIVRTSGNPDALIPALRSKLAEVDPNIALTSVMSMEAQAISSTARPRVVTLLLSLFGAVSLFLVAAGVYSTIAFSVARRTQELGLRASLGAGRMSILTLVLRQALGVTLVGIVLGLIGSGWGTRWLQGLLFGTGAVDPSSLVGVSALLFAVALIAAYLPARRAMRIDPMDALRAE